MVLGMGVVAVDVCPLSDCLRVLAVTVDGEMWVWESGNFNGKNSEGRNGDFKCLVKSSIKAPLASMRHRVDLQGNDHDMYDNNNNENNDDSNDSNSNNNNSRPNGQRIDSIHNDNDGDRGGDKEAVEAKNSTRLNKDRNINRSSSSSSSSSSFSCTNSAGVSLEECSLSSSGKVRKVAVLCIEY